MGLARYKKYYSLTVILLVEQNMVYLMSKIGYFCEAVHLEGFGFESQPTYGLTFVIMPLKHSANADNRSVLPWGMPNPAPQ